MLEIKSNQISFLNKFDEFMCLNKYDNLFNISFQTTENFCMYLSYIEKISDMNADIIMSQIVKFADDCQVDIYLHIVPKDLIGTPVSLSQFRKNQNGAKTKLEKYFKKYGFEIIRKEVVDLFIEIEMIRRHELY
jgi:hypothetical protein